MPKFGKHQDIGYSEHGVSVQSYITAVESGGKAPSQGQGSTFAFLTYLHKVMLLRSVESGPKCNLKVVFVTCSIVKHSWNQRRQAGASRGGDVLLLERLRRLLTEL